ncbi:MAG: hypothetical protein RJA98_2574 [Pseudomonadota bacterium]|jgi:hypothetical protein
MSVSFTSNMADVISGVRRLHPQFRFAAAKGLTDTFRMVHQALPAETERALDRPTDYTKRAFYFQGAQKSTLQASVGVKDRQAEYLQWQIDGGKRAPRRTALKLPSVVQLNESGNIPRSLVKALITRAKANKRATPSQARRLGVSNKLDLFYGEPEDGRPAGIYKRVVINSQRHQLVPIIVFPKQDANYTARRFDFYGFADRMVRRELPEAIDKAWAYALATAK